MIEKYMVGSQPPKKQSESRRKANEDIKRICSKNKVLKNEEAAESQDVSPALAEAIFGKIFGGDPETGEVPGARPMTDKEFCQLVYTALRRNVKDPEEFDKVFDADHPPFLDILSKKS